MIREALAKNLKKLRKRKAWNQIEAAEKIGITLSCYQKWESARLFPRDGNLERIAKVYGVTTTYLISAG